MKRETARTSHGQRPRDADATRGVLLDAATAVFAEQGLAGARVDEIAERAGANKALIYTYFGDKEGLYRAVLASRLAPPAAPVAAGAGGDPRRTLEDVVRRHFRLLIEDRAFARLLAWDLLTTGRGGRDILVESAGPGLDLVAGLVRRARAAGGLRAGVDPDLFRTAVVALALGYALQHPALEEARARGTVRCSDEDFVEYACRLLLEPGSAADAPARGGRPR